MAQENDTGHNDDIKAEDNVELIVRGPDGEIKQVVTAHNLLTTVGKEKLVERLLASPTTEGPKYIGVGKSAVEAKVSDTALGEQVKRKEATTRSASGNVLTLAVAFAAGEATGAITELGVFSASTSGTLFARLVFAVVNIEAADSLETKWTLTQN